MAGGKSDKQGNLQGSSWAARGRADPHTYHQNLKAFREALTGFSHVYHPEGLKNTVLKAVSLKTAPTVGKVGGWYTPRRGRSEESLIAHVQLARLPTVTSSP